MAAITVTDNQFDSSQVFQHVETFLPTYARPRFIRIQVGKRVTPSTPTTTQNYNLQPCDCFQASLDITGTFKYKKTKLVEDGFHPHQISDPVYFLDEKVRDYVPLTLDIFNAVSSGKIKI